MRIRRNIVTALAIACLAGLPVTGPAHAQETQSGDIHLTGASNDVSSWSMVAPPTWGCTVRYTPPTVTVTCTLPTVSICQEVDVTATAGGPGTVVGTVTCPPLTATATAVGPAGFGYGSAVGAGAPPMGCTVALTGNPAPWAVTCHAVIVKYP